jgi:hypothetical protein
MVSPKPSGEVVIPGLAPAARPNALGLKREPIDVTPVLNEYLSTLPAEPQDLVTAADESER